MSFAFIQESREDSIATVVLAFAITSKFWFIEQDSSILPFALLMAVLALILTKFFNFLAEITFGFLDYQHDYSGIASFRYAYDHINFMKYRQKLMANIRLIVAITIILLPPGPFWSFLGLNRDFSWIKKPFFLDWYGEITLVVLILLLLMLVFLTYFQIKNALKRLKIVRVTNTLVNWREDIQTKIRENQWETVFVQMEEVRDSSYEVIHEFKEYLRGIEHEAKKNTFMAFYIGNMDYLKHQSIFSKDKGALLLQQIEDYRQLQSIHPIEFGYITDHDETSTSADFVEQLELLPLTENFSDIWEVIKSIQANYEQLTEFTLESATDYQTVINEVKEAIVEFDEQIATIIKDYDIGRTRFYAGKVQLKNSKSYLQFFQKQLHTEKFVRKLVFLHLSGFYPKELVLDNKFAKLQEWINNEAQTIEPYQAFLDKHQELVQKVMKTHELYHKTVKNSINLIIKEVKKLEMEIERLF